MTYSTLASIVKYPFSSQLAGNKSKFGFFITEENDYIQIANELGTQTSNKYGSNNTAYENGQLGGRVGGLMSKRLVEMGQQALLKQYNSKK